jgi:hypothetical protein
VTYPYADAHPFPQAVAPARVPGVVLAAAIVTWVVATGTAALTMLLTVGLLIVAGPVFDAFEPGADNPRWFVLAAGGVVVALSVVADVVALLVLRGQRWAQWVLVALSAVAALGGLFLAYYIAPLMITASAIAVIVLLLMPDAHAWSRHSR